MNKTDKLLTERSVGRKKNSLSLGCLKAQPFRCAASLLFTSTAESTGGHFKQGSKAQTRDEGLVIVSAAQLKARNCQDLILSPAPGLMEHVRAKVRYPDPSLGSAQMASRPPFDRHSGTISLRWSSWRKH